jgi:hypothetical protein
VAHTRGSRRRLSAIHRWQSRIGIVILASVHSGSLRPGSLGVEVKGPIGAGAIVWSLSGQLRVTAIAKTRLLYDHRGEMRAVEPAPLVAAERAPNGAPCDLAPFVPGAQVICLGAAQRGEVAIRVARAGNTLFERRVVSGAVSELGPVVETHLMRFGAGVVALDAGVRDHKLVCAPPEQRTAALAGDETVTMTGLDPELEHISVTLPPFALRIMATIAGEDVTFDTRLDTLVLEPASRLIALVWRGSFPVRAEMVSSVKLLAKLGLGPRGPAKLSETMPAQGGRAPSVPFVAGSRPSAPPPIAADLYAEEATGTVALSPRIPRAAATPFEPHPAETTTVLSRDELKRAADSDAVPFGGAATEKRPMPTTPLPGAPWTDEASNVEVRAPSHGAGTVDLEYLSRDLHGDDDVPAPWRAPPPEPAPRTPQESNAAPTEAKSGEPWAAEPWVKGPREVGGAAESKVRRPARRNLNAALYGNMPKKKGTS